MDEGRKSMDGMNPADWIVLYGDLLFKYAKARVQDEAVAEDLVQDAFLSALKHWEGFREESTVKTWLFSILKNKILNYYRKAARELLISGLTLENLPENPYFTPVGKWNVKQSPEAGRSENLTELEAKEFYKVLLSSREKLQELQNAVFTMKYLDDLNSQEICKELEISVSYYWTLMHRAKLQLRKCMELNWVKY